MDAETAPEAAEELKVRETVPPATAVLALLIERLGVALETVLAAVATFTLLAPELESSIFPEKGEEATEAVAARRT